MRALRKIVLWTLAIIPVGALVFCAYGGLHYGVTGEHIYSLVYPSVFYVVLMGTAAVSGIGFMLVENSK